MSPNAPFSNGPFAVCAVSGHLDTRTAAMEIAEQLEPDIAGRCDLLLLFASYHHRAAFAEAAGTIRQTLHPTTMLGVTAESVIGSEQEMEGVAGMSVIGFRLPGVQVQPWISTPRYPIPHDEPETIAQRIGMTDDFRGAIMLPDPFSTSINDLLPAISTCRGEGQPTLTVGGMASGASQPGQNVLMVDDQFMSGGLVGVSLAGDIEVECIVSQGCRPVSHPLLVTKAHDNIIEELGGQNAVEVLQELAGELSEHERELLGKGLLIGTVINEYKDHFGRGDFLIRNIIGVNRDQGAIMVADNPRIGQTVQFHVRDATTASEDLQLLLDGQQLKPPPFGVLLFTCNGRGKRLFEEPNHDVSVIRDRLANVPIAGFFAAGELGPVGDRCFMHGHTAVAVMLRSKHGG